MPNSQDVELTQVAATLSPLTGIMTDKEQREYNKARRDVADALEKLEKMYGVAMLRRTLENQDKQDLRPRHLAILLDQERQKDI